MNILSHQSYLTLLKLKDGLSIINLHVCSINGLTILVPCTYVMAVTQVCTECKQILRQIGHILTLVSSVQTEVLVYCVLIITTHIQYNRHTCALPVHVDHDTGVNNKVMCDLGELERRHAMSVSKTEVQIEAQLLQISATCV